MSGILTRKKNNLRNIIINSNTERVIWERANHIRDELKSFNFSLELNKMETKRFTECEMLLKIRKLLGQTPKMNIFLASINCDFTTWTGTACLIMDQLKSYTFVLISNCKMILWELYTLLQAQHLGDISVNPSWLTMSVFANNIHNTVYCFIFENALFFFFKERQPNSIIFSSLIIRHCLTLGNKTKRWAAASFHYHMGALPPYLLSRKMYLISLFTID